MVPKGFASDIGLPSVCASLAPTLAGAASTPPLRASGARRVCCTGAAARRSQRRAGPPGTVGSFATCSGTSWASPARRGPARVPARVLRGRPLALARLRTAVRRPQRGQASALPLALGPWSSTWSRQLATLPCHGAPARGASRARATGPHESRPPRRPPGPPPPRTRPRTLGQHRAGAQNSTSGSRTQR